MEWTDEGVVLGTRKHGEANAILELMTRDHGRHLGLVRGITVRSRSVVGNFVGGLQSVFGGKLSVYVELA